jgi:hypothetical protein
MMRFLRPIGIVLTIALIAPGARADTPAAAPATAVDEGRLHFQRGVTFYKDGDYRSALVEFQEAYRVAPNYRLMFNIGKTFAELQDFAGAVVAFRQYLGEGGTEISAARRTEVESDLHRLVGHVASLEIIVNEPEATLTAEGDRRIELGTSPRAQPVLLNSGTWTISARKSGFAVAEERVVVGGGDRKTVRLTLASTVAPAFVDTPAPREAPEPDVPRPTAVPQLERSMTPVYAGAAVTMTLAVAAGVTGILAVRAKSDYDTALAHFGSMPADVSGARTRTRTLALATDVLGGAALAGAIVTAVLYALRPPGPKANAPAANAATLTFDGLGAHGAF